MTDAQLDNLIQELPPLRSVDVELRQVICDRDWDAVLYSFLRSEGWDAFKILTDQFESAAEY